MLGRVRTPRLPPAHRHGRQAAAGGGATFTPGSAACLNVPSLPGCLPASSAQPAVTTWGAGGGMLTGPQSIQVKPISVQPYQPCPQSFTKSGCCTCNYTGGPLSGLGAFNFSDPKTLLMLAGGALLVWYLMKR
jgi:hypothetical protein